MDKYKFKVGDEVFTFQNKGMGNVYIYGAHTEHIPLNSNGKVLRINENLKKGTGYLIQFKENSAWMCEDELELLGSLQKMFNICEDLKNFENHPAFEIARQNPVFLIDKKIYSADKKSTKYYFDWEKNAVEKKTEPENSVELGSFADLDELMLQRSSTTIEKIQKEYVDEVKKDVLQIINQTAFVPQIILKYVFPYLRKEDIKEKIDELIQEDHKHKEQTEKTNKNSSLNREILENTVKKAVENIENLIKNIEIEEYEYIKNGKRIDESDEKRKEIIEEMLSMNNNELKNELKKEEEKYQMEQTSLMEKINEENTAIINGNVYECLQNETKKNELKITLDEKDFYLKKTLKNLDFLEEKYLFELYKKIRTDALKENFTKEKIEEMLEEENKKLPEHKGDAYSEQDFGYVKYKESDLYYVYLEVPAFAIKSQFDNNYYLFNKTRVGMPIYIRNQKLVYGSISLIDNNNHPFLHRAEGDFHIVCMGGNELPHAGKDMGDVIAKTLRRAKYALMYGYISDNRMRGGVCDELRTKCNGCEADHFAKHRKKLSELEQMGVPIITNEVFNKR